MNKRKPIEKKQISQGWLTTYSDLVTLILTFFVLLYSFSAIDTLRFKKIAYSLQNALLGGNQTILEYNQNTGDVPVIGENLATETDSLNTTGENAMSTYDAVVDFIEKNSLAEFVNVKGETRGVVIEFKDKILFDTGKADIKQEGIPVLMKVAELLRSLSSPIIIEGHTDNVPIHTAQFPSNWELSAARALKVLWYMTENRQLDPKRFSIAAYGEYSPIASNDTEEGRAQNRRVNMVIVTSRETIMKE